MLSGDDEVNNQAREFINRVAAQGFSAGLNRYEVAELQFLTSPPSWERWILKIWIGTIGSHPKILELGDPELGPELPPLPDRVRIQQEYAESITSLELIQDVEIQKAEEMGRIDSILRMRYLAALHEKRAALLRKVSALKILDLEKVDKARSSYLPLEGGMLRRAAGGSKKWAKV